MRILLDYRPALRERTGVGEYVHELTRALARTPDSISIFSASWKDRPSAATVADLRGVTIVHRRLPVRALTWSWHHMGWPPIEWLADPVDVVHAQTPLLIPSTSAARVVTIHDLDFLHHPERAHAEMQRDYPRLVREHATRADHVIVSSLYAAREVMAHLDLPPERISVCSPGAPEWAVALGRSRGSPVAHVPHVLFVGTIERRKNVRGLIAAYARLRASQADVPKLVLAGRLRPGSDDELHGVSDLAEHVSVLGYVSEERRRELYRDACMLVLPSFEEGFGLPVLEAMAAGVPVVVSNRGSLPEVAGDAASPVDPEDVDALAAAMDDLLHPTVALEASRRGTARAAHYSWDACAAVAREAYRAAVAARERRAR